MNPFMQDSIMSSTGMPTLGRRAKGFGIYFSTSRPAPTSSQHTSDSKAGASPFGPGGAVPVHHMNFLMGGLGRHGMQNSPFSAGSYPHPQAPFPLGYTAAPMMPMSMGPHMMGGSALDSFITSYPSTPFSGPICGGGMSSYPSWPMGGFGGSPTLMDGLDDLDDNGVWDGDDDVEDLSGPFDLFYRANRRAKRRNNSCGMFSMMPMHMGMGMLPIGCM